MIRVDNRRGTVRRDTLTWQHKNTYVCTCLMYTEYVSERPMYHMLDLYKETHIHWQNTDKEYHINNKKNKKMYTEYVSERSIYHMLDLYKETHINWQNTDKESHINDPKKKMYTEYVSERPLYHMLDLYKDAHKFWWWSFLEDDWLLINLLISLI